MPAVSDRCHTDLGVTARRLALHAGNVIGRVFGVPKSLAHDDLTVRVRA